MKPLPAPPATKAVLSFDFDGTLHYGGENPPVPPAFFHLIRRLRASHGIAWGINTGRSMPQMVEGIIESRFPFLPDWVVAREREIYFPNDFGRWLPYVEWNKRCEKEIAGLFKRSRKILRGIRHDIETMTGARWLEMDGEPAGIIATSQNEMEWITTRIGPLVADEPKLSWQRNSIYLRFGHRDFQKGSSLGKIADLYNLTAADCFAIGDSHNDIEMLDPTHAGMTACPANAVEPIKEKVRQGGGIITSASFGEGAVEAVQRYFPAF